MPKVFVYDSTLRDGAQMEGVAFSLADKLGIASQLDNLGVDYIEGGYATSNPKDMAFFQEVKGCGLKHAKVAAFGNTRRAAKMVEDDPSIMAILAADTPTATVVGKSWDLHIRDVIRVSPEDNLRMIEDSVKYLKSKGREVIYDAEHFYDGYKSNAEVALATLMAAAEAGADALVLCDTNGGCLPHEVSEITAAVAKQTGGAIGFHGHNDSGCALANTLASVLAGATHVQGCVNGFGERTGNADLCAIIADLQLKMGFDCLPDGRLDMMTEVSRFVYEAANLPLQDGQPFVGRSAFAHKGGLHVDAMMKNPRSYEHILPELVGNERRILVSELSGGATIAHKLAEFGVPDDKALRRKILDKVQNLENEGYQFEIADGSFKLLVRRIIGDAPRFFELEGFRTIVEKRGHNEAPITEATVKVLVDGVQELCASEGDGPVNALDGALRKSLEPHYPRLRDVHLADYKVRVVNPGAESAAKVRVIAEFAVRSTGEHATDETGKDAKDAEETKDALRHFATVGVSENIVDASWQAISDAFEYHLIESARSSAASSPSALTARTVQ